MSPRPKVSPDKPKRVAIYARYSSDLQHERSIDDQIRVCRDRARREGWLVHDCYADHAISGADMRRPGLQNLMRDARIGKFEIVLSEALDRLSRDQADIATIFKRMEYARIDIVTLSEGRVGILDVGLRGTMNQLFRVETGNKVRRGQQGRILEGKTAGSLPYGYDLVRRLDARGEIIRGERKINEYKAQVVRRIFEEYASGQSVRSIVKRLNEEGVPGPWGKLWRPNTISGDPSKRAGILNNEVYIGRLVWNRRSFVRDPETGKRRYRVNAESEWTRGSAPNLRIINDSLWERVRERQRRLANPKLAASLEVVRDVLRGRPRSLLTGLAKCGCCGGTFEIRKGGRFGCATYANFGACRNHLRIGRAELEAEVLHALKQQFRANPDTCVAFCELYARLMKDLKKDRDDLVQRCMDELSRIEANYDRLTDLPKSENDTSPAAEMRRLTARHEVVSRHLRRAQKAVEPFERYYWEQIEGMVDALNLSRTDSDSFQAFRAVIGQIVLTPNKDDSALVVDFGAGAVRRSRGS